MATGRDLDAAPLTLAENGRSRYRIVSALDGGDATRFAVKELATFLEQVTGATFDIAWDDTPPSPAEIVVGPTNRMSLDDLPADL